MDVTEIKNENDIDNKLLEIAQEPEPEPQKETPETKPEDTSKEVTPKAEDTPEAKPAGEKTDQEPDKLLAGKYKTPDDLTKSVNELIEKLDVPLSRAKAIEKQIVEAKESKDFSKVEELYKTLQSDFTKSTQQKKEEAQPEREKIELGSQVNQFIKDESARQLRQHPIAKEFDDLGLEMPKNEAELRELRRVDPFLWQDFLTAAKQIYKDTHEWAMKTLEMDAKKESIIETAKTEGEGFINKINQQHKLGLTPEQVKGYIDEALSNEENYTEQYGVKIPKANAIRNHFMINAFEGLMDKIIANAESNGMDKKTKAIKEMNDAVVESASTAGKHIAQRKGSIKRDWSDPNSVMMATEEERERRLNEIKNAD